MPRRPAPRRTTGSAGRRRTHTLEVSWMISVGQYVSRRCSDEEERKDQGQLQCNNGKAAQKRHPVTPANGEPSQPCQPQDVSGNAALEGCIKADVLVREFPRRVWADSEHGEDIGDNRRTHGDGEKHHPDTAEKTHRRAAVVPCSFHLSTSPTGRRLPTAS